MDHYRRRLWSVALDLVVAKRLNGEFYATNSVVYIPDELNFGGEGQAGSSKLPEICVTTNKTGGAILANSTALNEHGLLVASFGGPKQSNPNIAKLKLEPGKNAATLRLILPPEDGQKKEQQQHKNDTKHWPSGEPMEIPVNIFLWDEQKEPHRLVWSDIDGTITRSDKRGLLLPMFGIKWAQKGVVELFWALAAAGYQLVYLSSRPIPLLNETREYLHDDLKLPDGPIFLCPQGIKATLSNMESVMQPVPFKKSVLQQIKEILPPPPGDNHFCLGIGNQQSDVDVYRAFNLPRIFIVDEAGIITVYGGAEEGEGKGEGEGQIEQKQQSRTSNYAEIRANLAEWLPPKIK